MLSKYIGKKVSIAVKRSSLWTPNYIRVFLTNLFVSMIANGLPSVFTLFLLSRGGTDMDSGIATGCFYAVSLIARPITGWFVDHRGRKGILLFSLVGLVLVPWAYILLPWVVGIILARTVHGTMEAISNTALTTASTCSSSATAPASAASRAIAGITASGSAAGETTSGRCGFG